MKWSNSERNILKKGLTPVIYLNRAWTRSLKNAGRSARDIIAAKNPSEEDLKNEMCDLIYHMMVLMAEKNVEIDSVMELEKVPPEKDRQLKAVPPGGSGELNRTLGVRKSIGKIVVGTTCQLP